MSETETYRILIVEDEVIIADTIERYLSRKSHVTVGKAISYEEGVHCFHETNPDLVLIDIRLSGPRNGIELATYINRQPTPVPFIYLTSQMDTATLNTAQNTFPASYLSKPIQANTLLASVAVVMHNHRKPHAAPPTVTLFDGRYSHRLPISDIEYLRADHVYVRVMIKDKPHILLRRTLTDLLNESGMEDFVQTHRSYAVNRNLVTHYDRDRVYVGDHSIPLSRSQRKKIGGRL